MDPPYEQVVVGEGMSSHGPTITPPLITTHHISKLWHKLYYKL